MLTTITPTSATWLGGAVVLPGDAGWDEARSGFNLLLDQHPAAVALPADARDVAAAVAYARRAGLRVAPQATAHNQGPLGDLENTLLLNVGALQEVRVDAGAQRVRVGAGVKWDRVAPRLSAHGLAGLHGSSPDVGSPATHSAAAWVGWRASTACRPTR
jgi:FAD/FMN-containing dehydrogenase